MAVLINQETEEQSLPSDHEDEAPQETEKLVEEETKEPEEPEEEPQSTPYLSEEDEPQPLLTTGDLLVIPIHSDLSLFQISPCFFESKCLLLRYSQNMDEELHPMIADLEQSNALALAIVGPGMYWM
jgi:hypothetical protein